MTDGGGKMTRKAPTRSSLLPRVVAARISATAGKKKVEKKNAEPGEFLPVVTTDVCLRDFLGDLRSLVRFVSFWKKRAKSE